MVLAAKYSNLVIMSSQMAMEKELDSLSEAISHNGVIGFQSSTPKFEDYVQDNVSYLKFVGTIRNLEKGTFKETGQKLDIASTEGYFAVMTPQGIRYSRNGHFLLNPTGQIVNTAGYTLLDENNSPITLKESESVVIGVDGTVSTHEGIIGRIKVVNFQDEQQLDDTDLKGYFKSTSPEVITKTYQIHQGYLEESNVDTIKALTRLSMLSSRWNASHQIQKNQDDLELEAPSKLAPVN